MKLEPNHYPEAAHHTIKWLPVLKHEKAECHSQKQEERKLADIS